MPIKQTQRYVAFVFVLIFLTGVRTEAAPPSIDGKGPARVIVGNEWMFQPAADDADGDKLTFRIRNRPRWATFWTGSGRLFGTPTAADVGIHDNIIIEVSDGNRTVRLPAFSIRVDPLTVNNKPPTISGTPRKSIPVRKWYSFTPKASDPNGHALTFEVRNKPNWAQFDRYTGRLFGRPWKSSAGTYGNIVIVVTDGKGTAKLPAFSISVGSATSLNEAPKISGDPPSRVVVGNRWSLQVDASDADGDKLTFKVRNKPGWMTFWEGSGRLFGTPGYADVGWHGDISIEVSDGRTTRTLPKFAVRVDSTSVSNSPPTIGGNPDRSVAPGNWYDFTPASSDPNDHALQFRIRNKPSWTKFDNDTGRLYGRPYASHVGSYGNIVIEVTDGIATRSLNAFAITVGNTTSGSITLSWTPPTRNTDGSPLNNLAGYRIYYGKTKGNYPNRIVLNNPGLSAYTVQNLQPGTYYFVSTAVNSQGVESNNSNVATKSVQ